MSDNDRAVAFFQEGWAAILGNENPRAFDIAEQILLLHSSRLANGRRDLGFAYEGYSIKGIVYLREGNLESAEKHLILAGKSLVPTASTTTFGPNFCLMQILYEQGCRTKIVEFLSEYCLPVCLSRRSELESWINAINAGRELSFNEEIQFNSWLYV